MAEHKQVMLLQDVFALAEHPDRLEWKPFRTGIDIYPIYKHNGGCSAALIRYAPGAALPAHEHMGYEHILVLAGEQHDENHAYPKGTLVISPPGTTHSIKSQNGCLVLAIWEKPVNFI